MLSSRTSNILGLTIPLLTLVILFLLLVIWRWRLRNARSKSRSKPIPLALHRARFEKHGTPISASSYASTFNFPQKDSDNTLADLKDPFRFPTPLEKPVPLAALPPLPSPAVMPTAYRAYAAPPLQNVDMEKGPMSSTPDSLHPYASHKYDDGKGDLEGSELSYYEETLPTSPPPSYHRAPSRTRSHSPLSNPLRSASLRQSGILSRKSSANASTRRMSQPIDITVSTDVHIHIDSLYVESHGGGDGQTLVSDDMLRIMSVAPQIPSIYLGVPFEAFTKLEGELEEGTVGAENLGVSTLTLDDPQAVNAAHSSRQGSFPTAVTTSVRHLEKAALKDGRPIPAGWF